MGHPLSTIEEMYALGAQTGHNSAPALPKVFEEQVEKLTEEKKRSVQEFEEVADKNAQIRFGTDAYKLWQAECNALLTQRTGLVFQEIWLDFFENLARFLLVNGN